MAIKRGKAENSIIENIQGLWLHPNYVELSRKTGVNTTTLCEAWKRMVSEGRVKITVEVLEERYEYRKIEG